MMGKSQLTRIQRGRAAPSKVFMAFKVALIDSHTGIARTRSIRMSGAEGILNRIKVVCRYTNGI